MHLGNLKNALMKNLSLSLEYANSVIDRLSKCKNAIYADAVERYALYGERAYLEKESYSTDILMGDYGMDYLNAVMMLVWIENEPEEALFALDAGIDSIV